MAALIYLAGGLLLGGFFGSCQPTSGALVSLQELGNIVTGGVIGFLAGGIISTVHYSKLFKQLPEGTKIYIFAAMATVVSSLFLWRLLSRFTN